MTTTIRFHQCGSPDVFKVEDDHVGPPGPGQVRLRQEAVGVNFIDTAFRTGSFPMPLSGVTGVEAAGVVDEVIADSVDLFLPSDQPDLAARVRRVAPEGVDVVYEFVGKATFAASMAAVRDGGKIVTRLNLIRLG